MKRILFTEADQFPISRGIQDLAASNGIELVHMDGYDLRDIERIGRDCIGALLFRARVNDELLEHLPSWKILARVGTGYDKIDLDAARRRGVVVTHVPGAFTGELSNQAMMFLLAFSRQLPFAMAERSRSRWPVATDFPPTDRLSDQTLGIIGLGPSGEGLARRARAFGLKLKSWSRTKRPELSAELGVHECELVEALACDYVSLHLALTPQTRHIINQTALDAFSRGSVLINISRGELVDTTALVDALTSGHLRGAGLDVTDPEPLPLGHPLWTLPNVLLTFHTAALTALGVEACMAEALMDIGRFIANQHVAHMVPELVTTRGSS